MLILVSVDGRTFFVVLAEVVMHPRERLPCRKCGRWEQPVGSRHAAAVFDERGNPVPVDTPDRNLVVNTFRRGHREHIEAGPLCEECRRDVESRPRPPLLMRELVPAAGRLE